MTELAFVVPVYLQAPYLAATLESLRQQAAARTRVSVRLVEVPRDGEGAALGVDLSQWPDVTVLRAAAALGIGGDWEAALDSAAGPYVTLAHSDDLYRPDYAAAVLDAFSRFPDAGVVFTDAQYTDSSPLRSLLRLIKKGLTPGQLARGPVRLSAERMRRALKFGNFIPCPSAAYNRPVLRNALGSEPLFDRTFGNLVDWKAWLALAHRGVPFVYLPRTLVTLRVHEGTTTQASIAAGERSVEERAILEQAWGPTVGGALARVFQWGQRLQRVSPKKP